METPDPNRYEAGLFLGALGQGIREAIPEGAEKTVTLRTQNCMEEED
jgi:hypothetical protein